MVSLANEIDFIGEEIPLSFVKGEDLAFTIIFDDGILPNPTREDITGNMYTVTIVPEEGGIPLATFTPTLSDPTEGELTLTLDTSGLSEGAFWWEAWEVDGSGIDRHLWCGPVYIQDRKTT